MLNRAGLECRDGVRIEEAACSAPLAAALDFHGAGRRSRPGELGRRCSPRRGARPSTSTPGAAPRTSTPISTGPATRLEQRYGVKLVHVKLDDTAEAVARVVAEKAAGNDEGGSVDLIWINGENFAAMKQQDLLFARLGGAAAELRATSTSRQADRSRVDFTVPADGLESPWGMAQLVFFYDSARAPSRRAAEFGQGAARLGRGRIPAASPIRSRRISSARPS